MVSKMENEQFNVLEHVIKERDESFDFPDEAIFSNVYYTSLFRQLRGRSNVPAYEIKNWENGNRWLLNITSKAADIPVIAFDKLKSLLMKQRYGVDNNGQKSCDAFFYNFDHQDNEFHFLAELKNTDKKRFIDDFLIPGFTKTPTQQVQESSNGKKQDSLYKKAKDSIELIRQEFLFGGNQEGDELISNIHLVAVYNGKNTRHTSSGPRLPGKGKASKGSDGKQCYATRNTESEPVTKAEYDVYNRFGNQLAELGLKPRNKDTFFPIRVDPKINAYFTFFSAQDFGQLIDSGFFDNWKWGRYLPNVESTSEDSTEGSAENT